MPCPFCGSRRTLEEYTVRTFDLPEEWVAINHVLCAKCGECYSKTVRDNLRTGKRRVTVSRKSCIESPSIRHKPARWSLRLKLFGRWRR